MGFTRGTRDDYDRWANITEDDGWSWNNLYPYMIKVNDAAPNIAMIFSADFVLVACGRPRWRI